MTLGGSTEGLLYLRSTCPICRRGRGGSARELLMSFRVQAYKENEFGVPCPLDPQEVFASSPGEAAEKVCGRGLVEKALHGRIAAKVWLDGPDKADIKLFYRRF